MFSSFIHVNSRVLFFMAELCVSVYVCESLSDSLHPMDYSPPGSSVHGLLQARVLEWVVSLSIHLLIGCFPILAIKNKTARNVGVQLSLQDLFFFFFKCLLEYHWFKILISFPSDKYPEVVFIWRKWSRIAGSHGNSIFNILRKLHTVFHRGCTNLYPTISVWAEGFGFPFLHILANSVFSQCKVWGIRWLICICLMISGVEHFFVCP